MTGALHRFVEHTGELELVVQAPTETGIFEEALAAFRSIVGVGDGETVRRDIEVSAPDRESLLVAWLGELVFLAEIEGFVPDRAASLALAEGRLRAAVVGHFGRPSHLVKAVTLNSLELREEGGSWHARVVLDV